MKVLFCTLLSPTWTPWLPRVSTLYFPTREPSASIKRINAWAAATKSSSTPVSVSSEISGVFQVSGATSCSARTSSAC